MLTVNQLPQGYAGSNPAAPTRQEYFPDPMLLLTNWNKSLSFQGRYCGFESRREYYTEQY